MAASTPPPRRHLVAGAIASGVLTAFVPPARTPPPLRRSLHAGLGLAAAGATAWSMGRPESGESGEPADLPSLAVRVGMSVAVGSLAALASAAGVGLDTAIERALVRRGVRHPRVWLGVAAATLTAAASWAEHRSPDGPGQADQDGPVDITADPA